MIYEQVLIAHNSTKDIDKLIILCVIIPAVLILLVVINMLTKSAREDNHRDL